MSTITKTAMSRKVRANTQLALTQLDTKLLSNMELSYEKNDSFIYFSKPDQLRNQINKFPMPHFPLIY